MCHHEQEVRGKRDLPSVKEGGRTKEEVETNKATSVDKGAIDTSGETNELSLLPPYLSLEFHFPPDQLHKVPSQAWYLPWFLGQVHNTRYLPPWPFRRGLLPMITPNSVNAKVVSINIKSMRNMLKYTCVCVCVKYTSPTLEE